MSITIRHFILRWIIWCFRDTSIIFLYSKYNNNERYARWRIVWCCMGGLPPYYLHSSVNTTKWVLKLKFHVYFKLHQLFAKYMRCLSHIFFQKKMVVIHCTCIMWRKSANAVHNMSLYMRSLYVHSVWASKYISTILIHSHLTTQITLISALNPLLYTKPM